MLEPRQMSRLLIAGTKAEMPGVIAELYRLVQVGQLLLQRIHLICQNLLI